jgi:hypothetical protein
MRKHLLVLFASVVSYGQIVIPDGTKIRLRLDQTLSSGTADEGQTVELSVTEAIKVDGRVVIAEGARASGTVVMAQAKRRMGRAGKLDFSVDRVRAADGEWIPVRYTLNKKAGDSKAVSTGIITAGVAVVFWPAAPFVLFRQGKDVTINKGVVVDVFTDRNHEFAANTQPAVQPAIGVPGTVTVSTPPPVLAPATTPTPAVATGFQPAAQMTPVTSQPPAAAEAGAAATVVITSEVQGADIEINGAYAGSTPTTLKLLPGQYNLVVRNGAQVWQRVLQVSAGSAITVNAMFAFPNRGATLAVR